MQETDNTQAEGAQTEDEQELAAERLQIFAARLSRIAHEQVQQRSALETRWLEDFRQYHGEYDPATSANLRQGEGSQVYVNITRNKSNAAEARLADMLFPTDDRNWAIQPTPVPELDDIDPGQMAQGPDGEPVDMRDIAAQVKREAAKRAKGMQKQIDDQLTESRYQMKARDVIHDAVLLGTGIVKGPVIVGRSKKRWDSSSGITELQIEEALEPSVSRVDPWDFYPDMSARTIDECEFIFERHLMTKRQLRDFARLPGALLSQLRRLIAGGKDNTQIAKDHTNDLRAITGVDSISNNTKYEVWEYHGPIDKADLIDALAESGEEYDAEEIDELDDEIEAVVFFAGNSVLKVVLNPMDTEDRPYSVFNWEKDESSVFGFGVPYLMRQPQRVINASWRMMLDNAGASASDIIVVNRDLIRPADGSWSSQPGKKKLYFLTDKQRNVNDVFGSYSMPNHQAEFANIFQMARQLADEETNLPLIAQGEQTNNITKTSSGMAMLMNSANIVLRRAVKNWDDDVTGSMIERFYDWNMQYSEDPSIKGDYNVDARGSGALLVREKQQENLLIYANISAGNPELAIRRDWEGLDKEIAKALEVPYDHITLAKEEIDQQKEAMAEQGDPQMEFAVAEFQLKEAELELKNREMEFEQEYRIAELQHRQEKDHAELALKHELTVTQLQSKLGIDQERLMLERERTAALMQNDRDKTAASIMDKQNQRAMVESYKARKYGGAQ